MFENVVINVDFSIEMQQTYFVSMLLKKIQALILIKFITPAYVIYVFFQNETKLFFYIHKIVFIFFSKFQFCIRS